MVMEMGSRRGPKDQAHKAFAPGTRRLQRRTRQTPPYKVIAVGIYDDQAASLDQTATKLQQAGYLKANRSFVVQALVRKLQEETEGLNSDELFQMFFESYLRRPLSKSLHREQKQPDGAATPARRHKAG
jgi:hypothetical protein